MSDFVVRETTLLDEPVKFQLTAETDFRLAQIFQNNLNVFVEVFNLGKGDGLDSSQIETAINSSDFEIRMSDAISDDPSGGKFGFLDFKDGLVDQNGIVHYLTKEMTQSIDLLLRTLKMAGVTDFQNITKDNVLVWKSIAEQTPVIGDILLAAQRVGVAGGGSMQALTELIYVRTGSELLANQLDDLEVALTVTRDALDLLGDIQGLHNKITIPDVVDLIPERFGPGEEFLKQPGRGDPDEETAATNYKNVFVSLFKPYFEDTINPQIDFSAFGGEESLSLGNLTLPQQSNLVTLSEDNQINAMNELLDVPIITVVKLPIIVPTFGIPIISDTFVLNFSFDSKPASIEGIIQNPQSFIDIIKRLDELIDALALISSDTEGNSLDDDGDGQVDPGFLDIDGNIDPAKIDPNSLLARLIQVRDDIKGIETDIRNLIDTVDVAASYSLNVIKTGIETGIGFLDLDGDGNFNIIEDLALDDPNAEEIKKGINVLFGKDKDFEGSTIPIITTASPSDVTINFNQLLLDGGIDINNLTDEIAQKFIQSLVLKVWLTDGHASVDLFEGGLSIISDNLTSITLQALPPTSVGSVRLSNILFRGTYTINGVIGGKVANSIQNNITSAITAGEALNDTKKEELRRFLFIFEEYYKSAAAILNKITQLIERLAQGIAR